MMSLLLILFYLSPLHRTNKLERLSLQSHYSIVYYLQLNLEPLSTFKEVTSRVGSWSYPQILDPAEGLPRINTLAYFSVLSVIE